MDPALPVRRVYGRLLWFAELATVGVALITGSAEAAIGFVQASYSTPQSPATTVAVTYSATQTAADLNVVVVGWNDTSATVQQVKDSAGNVYSLAIGPTSGTALRQSIYYSANILGGANTVTVTFSQAATYPDIRILEYRGVSSLDVTSGGSGNGRSTSSGPATTNFANELVFGANTVATTTNAAGTGFTSRVITSPDGDIAEDQTVTSAGRNSATASLSSSGPWVMQMATFFAASVPAPTVTSISPNTGPTTGGTAVTISGTNFTSGATVTIGGAAATNVVVVSGSTITATTPPGTAGAATVTVAVAGQSGSLTGGFTYLAKPTVTGVSPGGGPLGGQTAVTITGTNFASGAIVTFGTAAATNVTVTSGTTITATTPPGSAGAVTVTVTNSNGQSGSLANGFTYLSPPTVTSVTPNSGSTGGGTAVTISGSNFASGATVTIGGAAAANVVVTNATTITATTPPGAAGAATVTVTVAGQSGSLTGGFTFVVKPSVTSVSPAIGPPGGGTAVTITGTNFASGAAVTFGAAAATNVTVTSGTTITATTPPGSGAVTVTVTNSNGQSGSLANGFTYLSPPTVTSVTPSSGSTAGGTPVTIAGSNFASGATVAIGGASATNVVVTNATTITATTPPGAAGAATITVTVAGQSGTLQNGFTYVTSTSISYVQSAYSVPQSPQTSVTVTFPAAQTASDLNVVVVGWNDSTAKVNTVTDTAGNVYALAVGPTVLSGQLSQSIYYARSIAAAAAGANGVTVSFSTAAAYPDIRILEYRGADPNSPVDVVTSSSGTSSSSTSGSATTTTATDLLFGANIVLTTTSGPGSGFTQRILTSPDGDIAEDQMVTAIGTYTATAPLISGGWIMQMVAFRTPTGPSPIVSLSTSALNFGNQATGTTSNPQPVTLTNTGTAQLSISIGISGANPGDFAQTNNCGTGLAPNNGCTINVTFKPTATGSRAASVVITDNAPGSPHTAALSGTGTSAGTQPPGTPSGLTATTAGSTQINLAWTGSTPGTYPISGYNIFRNGVNVATSTSNNYPDTGLQPSTNYTYTVQAVDTQGNTSSQSTPANATTTAASSTAYPLKVSANGRYLVDQNNAPFLLVGDAPQALIGNLSESQAATYFANRQKDGFNAGWINLLCDSYTFCNSSGTTYDGIAPFTSGNSPSNYDLSTPNPAYFARVDDMLNLAATYGIVAFLDPIETGGWLTTLESNGATKAFNYGVFLGNRYKSFPNIVWMSGNDFQDWNSNSTDNNLVKQVMAGIASVDPNHLQTTELNFNVSGSHDDGLLVPYTNLDGAYTYYPTYAEILNQYNAAAIPVFLEEANYEFENNTGMDPSTPEILRRQGYWTMCSGATGQLYGNHYTVTFTSGWQNELDTPGAIQLGYLKSFFGSRQWYNLVPDQNQTFVTAGYGTFSSSSNIGSNNYVTAAITPDGTLGVVYLPTIQTITVNLASFTTTVTARWFDPSNNTYTAISGSPFSNTGTRQFTPPGQTSDGFTDWVLVFEH
jgi:Protein of unknown function (DUF4038)/IPT/TIG domain/Putative collagen-binding domain of a collagenase/Abnormal spindle-like microcephaly-assoc'd, ASPM-SPD-2-Hydin/Fibronectin type III domain